MSDSLNVDVSLADELALSVELRVELGVLAFAIVIDRALLVNLRSQSLNESDASINARLVVLVHASLVFVESTEILFKVQQLVLEGFVISLSSAKICCLAHKLRNHTFFFGGLGGT